MSDSLKPFVNLPIISSTPLIIEELSKTKKKSFHV